jgi:mRNA-degrading endonuclease toxin of MazEF toxin-antitoxin module
MMEHSRCDVVLVRYQAAADTEPWLRPAVVVSSETYQQGRAQVLLAAVTSAERQPQPGDTVVKDWQEAGLLRRSLVTGLILTVSPETIDRKLGVLSAEDARGVESSLRLSLGL